MYGQSICERDEKRTLQFTVIKNSKIYKFLDIPIQFLLNVSSNFINLSQFDERKCIKMKQLELQLISRKMEWLSGRRPEVSTCEQYGRAVANYGALQASVPSK